MLTISVSVEGLDLFPGKPEVRAAIKAALRESSRTIKTRAEQNLSGRFVRIRTGALRRGMRATVKDQGDIFVATIRNVVFYGHILEGGWVPRKRTPEEKRAQAQGIRRSRLILFDAGDKRIVGTFVRPRPWFASAVTASIPDLERIFERELGTVVTRRPLFLAA